MNFWNRALIIILSLCFLLPVFAADKPNILILGEDAAGDSVPRSSRVFKRVLDALINQMHDKGFDVYDEAVLTLLENNSSHIRRTDSEIIEVARASKRPPIDVVVIFQIYASTQNLEFNTRINTLLMGRLLNVKTGKHLGNFEIDSGKNFTGPAQCQQECILTIVGDKSRILANDLGAVLAEKLVWMNNGDVSEPSKNNKMVTEYALIFDGFNAKEYMAIEEYLVIFSGYTRHRPIEIRHTRSEIWYQSSIGTAKLDRNLNKMLAELDMQSIINFEGNTFTVKRITFRNKEIKENNEVW
ncbi:hypothetical protein [Pseudoalteromonas denitrificans]|uniref:Uncharacterized protein n=1 Tax=Pseudoalteromonas denitrificans DSM 6059 TaxID=1123010 RepID=A0A1I1SB82_9GAMM|nr:hypothetical protein [Pseudoalteromonas denitrificans]SFD43726.1 hypothetical protein SAMN02745724_04525 [Pseudoalteromonas denitrificans DSM 6059]